MDARNVAMRLKPTTLGDFSKTFETNVVPILQKQKAFQDEIAFAMPGGIDVVAISLRDTKESAGRLEHRRISGSSQEPGRISRRKYKTKNFGRHQLDPSYGQGIAA